MMKRQWASVSILFCALLLLPFGATAATQEEKDKTLLKLLSSSGNLEKVAQVIREGADVNTRDNEGRTPLMYACVHPEYFDLLLENGADVNAVTWARETVNNSSPYRLVSRDNRIQVEGNERGEETTFSDGSIRNRDFFPASADAGTDSRRYGGSSVLMSLFSSRQEDTRQLAATMQKLIDRGADVNKTDVTGQTLLMALVDSALRNSAKSFPAAELFDCLILAGANVNAVNDQGDTALTLAVQYYSPNPGRDILVQKLIDCGADVHVRDKDRNTPLLRLLKLETYSLWKIEEVEALEKNLASLVKIFMKAGADINAVDRYGRTPLIVAAGNGCFLDVVRLLVEAGADIRARDPQGDNALLTALSGKRIFSAKQHHPDDRLPLDLDGVLFLLDADADPSYLYGQERTALQYSIRSAFYRRQDGPVFASGQNPPVFFVERLLKQGWTRQEKSDVLLELANGYIGNMYAIERFVHAGADINARDAEGKNFLMKALLHKESAFWHPNLPAVAHLFELGFDINTRDFEGGSFLTRPLTYIPTPEFISLLLQNGADVRLRDDKGRTCLHVAYPGSCVRLLLDAGADPNAVDAEGRTPLHVMNDIDALAALISADAQIDRRDNAGKTPLLSWMERLANPRGIPLMLAAGTDATAVDANGNTPLLRAMRYSRSVIPSYDDSSRAFVVPDLNYAGHARELLERGANPNAASAEGQTPLITLIRQSTIFSTGGGLGSLRIDLVVFFEEALSALFDYGVDADARDAAGMTAWDYARENGDPRVLELLKEAANTIRYPRRSARTPSVGSSRTPLMTLAGKSDDPSALARQLAKGADLEARDDDGWTALAHAAWNNPDPKIVRFLLEKGAKVDALDNQGKTPLMRAAWRNSNPEVVRALLEGGAHPGRRDTTGNTAIDIAIAHDREAEVLGLLLDAGACFADRSRLGGGMLRAVCAVTTRPASVRTLLEKGAPVDARDADGQTALMKAVSRNPRPEIVQILIEAGADVNAKDAKGLSVLDYTLKGNTDVYRLLVEAGVDLRETSVWWSPEEKALMQGKPDQEAWNTGPYRRR